MRIGILGGTFDPIHFGHLAAAEHAVKGQDLDRVLFVPANRSPLKPAAQTTAAHRTAMVRLAIAGDPTLALSTVDIERPPPSYAVDTVALLQRDFPADDFVFLIGTDQLADLPEWRAPEQLLQMVAIVALTRPGAQHAIADALNQLSSPQEVGARYIVPPARAQVTVQEMPAVAISASEIRRRLAGGKAIAGLTPDAVIAYITEHGLYR